MLLVTEHPLSLADAENAVADPGCGATLFFLGAVRNNHAGRSVVAVTYEAHPPLAERVFRELISEAQTHFSPQLRAVILHRTGRLQVGEVSTIIGVAAPHRDLCYEASRYLIEELKKRAPIWKEEHYVDGDSCWLDGTPLGGSDSCGGPIGADGARQGSALDG